MITTIDVSAAINGRAGLGRYAETLAAAMAEERPDSVHLFANLTEQAKTLNSIASLPMKTVRAGYKPWRMAVWMGQLARLGFDDLLEDADVFHAAEHLLLPLRRTPSVITVHDLIFKLLPEHHKKLNYWFLNAAMPLFVKRADHVIAVSESTKTDLMTHYGTAEEKVTVVYEAAAPSFVPQSPDRIAEVRTRYVLPERYLLAVGTIEPRKNYARLVEVLANLRRDDPELRLVVAGAEGWLSASFYEAITRFDQSDAVIRPGWVTDADLPALYAGAEALVQASLYEGFGLPVLEAMAVGVPVACSATSSLGEIAGGAALTFDPGDVEGITTTIRHLLDDSELREDLRTRGLARAAKFSWRKAAQETWAVYEHVAKNAG